MNKFVFFLSAVLLVCCRSKSDQLETVTMDFIPYSQLMFEENRSSSELVSSYPDFSEIYTEHIIAPIRIHGEISKTEILDTFRSIPQIQKLYDTTQIILGDLESTYEAINLGFSRHHQLFPEDSIPDVYTYISEFGVGAFNYDRTIVGIGLEFYLGKEFPYPDLSLFPVYVRNMMTKDYIPRRALEAYLEDKIPMPNQDRMIDVMCRNGKIQYILSEDLKDLADTVRFGYDRDELSWLEDNESEIWQFFIEEGLLYSTNARKYLPYVGPSPHSPGMPDEAPGATANWIGSQIIQKCLRQSGKSMDEVLEMQDGQTLVEWAKYKPR